MTNYEGVSGQQINKRKTYLFFSKSTTDVTKTEIKEALGVSEILHYGTYLGLPSLIGTKKQVLITTKKERVENDKVGKRSYCHRQVEKF